MTPRVTGGHNRTARTTALYFSRCSREGRGRMDVDRGRSVASDDAIRPAAQGGAPRRARRLPARTTRGRRGRHPLRRGAGAAARRHAHHAARRRLRDDYQRALDAYETAKARLAAAESATDVTGVTRALARRPLRPTPACWPPATARHGPTARAVLLRPRARSGRRTTSSGRRPAACRASYPSASATRAPHRRRAARGPPRPPRQPPGRVVRLRTAVRRVGAGLVRRPGATTTGWRPTG